MSVYTHTHTHTHTQTGSHISLADRLCNLAGAYASVPWPHSAVTRVVMRVCMCVRVCVCMCVCVCVHRYDRESMMSSMADLTKKMGECAAFVCVSCVYVCVCVTRRWVLVHKKMSARCLNSKIPLPCLRACVCLRVSHVCVCSPATMRPVPSVCVSCVCVCHR